jgi:hypothetical protein
MPHSPPQKLIRPDVGDGSISTKQGRPSHVALRPASDRTADIDDGPFGAINRPAHLFDCLVGAAEQRLWHRDVERLGVLRLMTSSTFVGFWMGRSIGFPHLRIRSKSAAFAMGTGMRRSRDTEHRRLARVGDMGALARVSVRRERFRNLGLLSYTAHRRINSPACCSALRPSASRAFHIGHA